MELYLQLGFGMMKHSRILCHQWKGGTVILSPRDLDKSQLIQFSSDIRSLNGKVLIDPQFYNPAADHPRLTSYEYWQRNLTKNNYKEKIDTLLFELTNLNDQVLCEEFIIPGFMKKSGDTTWQEIHNYIYSRSRIISTKPIIMTICLSQEVVKSISEISDVITFCEQLDVYGYYLVFEKPSKDYFTDDPNWLINSMDLSLSLKRQNKKVVIGYCNHQQLIMACLQVDAIASGTFMNLRNFDIDKFSAKESAPRKKKPWFYYPQAFSEYRLSYLDLAFTRYNMIDEFRPDPNTPFAEPLFLVSQPSTTGWGEREAYRHYLSALHSQVVSLSSDNYSQQVAKYSRLLDQAEQKLEKFHELGLTGQHRDFKDFIDVNKSALSWLNNTYGGLLEHIWNDL